MKYKFKYNFSTLFNWFIFAMLIIWTIILAFNCFRVFSLFQLTSRNAILEVTTAIIALALIILLFLIKKLRYVVSDTLALKFGTADLNKGKFKIDKIHKIVQSTKDDQLFLNIFVGTEPQIVLVNIHPKQFDDFVEILKAKNPKILFDKADIE